MLSLITAGGFIIDLSFVARDGHRLVAIGFATNYQLALASIGILVPGHEVSTVIIGGNDVALD
jgi:hypothetical protein